MTKEEWLLAFKQLTFPPHDKGVYHGAADELLVQFVREFGHGDIADAWEKVKEVVGWDYEEHATMKYHHPPHVRDDIFEDYQGP
jgi:hypothetical protein